MPDAATVSNLRTLAVYQWGRGAGSALFPGGEPLDIERSRSGRPRQVVADDGRLVSLPTHGRFTLGIAGGHRLHEGIEGYRVTIGDESEPYVRDGRNVFAKFVSAVDSAIRPDDEILVVHEDGRLLAVGRAELSAAGMGDFDQGVAVSVRDTVDGV